MIIAAIVLHPGTSASEHEASASVGCGQDHNVADCIQIAEENGVRDLSQVGLRVPGRDRFEVWFDELTPDQFDRVWEDRDLRRQIKSRLRQTPDSVRREVGVDVTGSDGGLHEWYMVRNAAILKRWGASYRDLVSMQQQIVDVAGTLPDGRRFRHGASGSGTFHSLLNDMVETSNSLDEFVNKVKVWSDKYLDGGADALPPMFRYQDTSYLNHQSKPESGDGA